MKIRRYEIDYIFKTLNLSNLYDNIRNNECQFICIPRYNICINLRVSSIRFFFTYVYKVRTYKTYLIWFLLLVVSTFPFLHKILSLVKLKYQIKKTKSYEKFNWTLTDLIYVEWHFFGVFSKKNQTVTHVLAKDTYKQRFFNELSARNHNEVYSYLFPRLIKHNENPMFYTEELAVSSGQHLISDAQFESAQEILININIETAKTIAFDTYYLQLLEKIGDIKNDKFLDAFLTIKKDIEVNYLDKNQIIELALVHGDFNKGQLLFKNGNIKIIDWGDGGFLNRYFDYLSITINNSPNQVFKKECFPNDFKVLQQYFNKKLTPTVNVRLYLLITLLEIFAISKGEFEAEEGAYPRWLSSVENNIKELV